MTKHRYNLLLSDRRRCAYDGCTNEPSSLWHGISVDGDEVMRFTATYCTQHAKNHAVKERELTKVGNLEYDGEVKE